MSNSFFIYSDYKQFDTIIDNIQIHNNYFNLHANDVTSTDVCVCVCLYRFISFIKIVLSDTWEYIYLHNNWTSYYYDLFLYFYILSILNGSNFLILNNVGARIQINNEILEIFYSFSISIKYIIFNYYTNYR